MVDGFEQAAPMHDKPAHLAPIAARSCGSVWRWFAIACLMLTPGQLAAQGGIQVGNVTWVTATGSASENCQALRDVLASPVSGPRLVRLEPGFYDCGTTSLLGLDDVTLEGSGRDTVIFGVIDDISNGIINLGEGTSLTDLSVTNLEPSPVQAAIAIYSTSNATLTDVTAIVGVVSGTAYPLFVDEVAGTQTATVRIEGGSFRGGSIRATTPFTHTSPSLIVVRAALQNVNADPSYLTACLFWRRPSGDVGDLGPDCP